jgi:hypothetical protein
MKTCTLNVNSGFNWKKDFFIAQTYANMTGKNTKTMTYFLH